MLTSLIGVVILLGGLIFFHELGHYSIAKLFGVRVEVFSLGFGKKIFRRVVGETEYCLSLFPLGGYVKLMGDDPYKGVPPEDAHRAFSTQKLYKRFLIVAAGPLANLLLAFVLLMLVFWFGQPTVGTRVGAVVANSPAWEAGIRPKDRLVEIRGEKVETWNQVEEVLRNRMGEQIDLKLDRAGTELRIPVTVQQVRSKNAYGEDEEVGGIRGISPSPIGPMLGISNPSSPAYIAGLRTGDVVTKMGSRGINVYEDINESLAEMWQKNVSVTFTVNRSEGEKKSSAPLSFTLTLIGKMPEALKLTPFGLAENLGIYPSEVFVRAVTAGSPAEKGGLQPGDRIAKVGVQPIYNFESIVDRVQESGKEGQPIAMGLERMGQSVVLNLVPIQSEQEDPITMKKFQKFMVGFAPQTALAEPEIVFISIHDPIKLVSHTFSETFLLAERMLVSMGKLIIGQISVKNLGGPVLIASVAGKSLDAGIIPFIQMMALISINLFLLNLFPIPILDGGHLLFFTLEALKGRPVSIRTMEVANQLGMVFILMLVGLTLFNDISRMVLH